MPEPPFLPLLEPLDEAAELELELLVAGEAAEPELPPVVLVEAFEVLEVFEALEVLEDEVELDELELLPQAARIPAIAGVARPRAMPR